jgi:pyrimidine operon attenuation protein/uracil phosphoribosyltransferase
MLAHPPDHHPFSAQALPDAELLLTNLIEQIRPHVTPETGIVGIHTGGVWLAERIHAALGIISPLGTLDVSFDRDDFTKTGMRRHVKSSDVPFAVDGARMLIVDDVLFTGRTIRAALNELFDYGRPACIELAALIDRGGRELPIAARFVGQTLDVPPTMSIELTRNTAGTLALQLSTN